MDIQLNFINQSNDTNNSEVVVFQKNVANNYDELAVAWTVIRNCGLGDNHPFSFPLRQSVGASDAYGNSTPLLDAQDGQLFEMALTGSGDQLRPAGPATNPNEVQVRNSLSRGAINANVYKSGKLLAMQTSIAPGQKADFAFKPTIWIGAVSQIMQGEVMNSAILSSMNTQISLLGIASADIIMTGGGAGPNARPFEFRLDNIQAA